MNINGSCKDQPVSVISSIKKTKKVTLNDPKSDSYEPSQDRDPNGLGTMGALFHMIKGSLGSGILAMPMAFKNGGLWVSLIGSFLIGYLCTHCVHMLVHCSQTLSKRLHRPYLSFADTAEVAFQTGPARFRKYGTFAREFVNISLMITYYFGDTVYIVLIASVFKQIADNFFEVDLNIRLYILMLTVILVPMGSIRHLKYLVPFSFVAIVMLMIGCGAMLFDAFSDLPPTDSRPAFGGWHHLPLFYATMCFAIEGIGTVLPIENSMILPAHFLSRPWVLNIAMVWLVLTYTIVGFFGYLRYGNATEGNVILNLGHTAVGETVKILVALNVVCSYPLLFCVVSESAWKYVEPRLGKLNKTRDYYLMRIILILGNVMLATAIPNLEPIIGFVGSVCFSTLGLLLPSILEVVTFWGDAEYMGVCGWRYGKNLLLAVAWLVALVAGVNSSINSVVELYWPSSTPIE